MLLISITGNLLKSTAVSAQREARLQSLKFEGDTTELQARLSLANEKVASTQMVTVCTLILFNIFRRIK